MRVTFVCSECGRQRQAEERDAALGIRCPGCSAFMDLADPGTHAMTSLQLVGKGLALVYAGLCLYILAFILVCVAPLAVLYVFPQMSPGWVAFLFGLVLTLFVAAIVADVVGRLLCLAMPSEDMTAKTLAVLSVVFGLAALAICGWQASTLLFSRPRPPAFVEQLASPLGLIGSVLFLLFLRSLAQYVGRPDLARWALLVLAVAAVTFAAYTTLFIWSLVADKPLLYSLWGLTVVGLALAMLILYGNLLVKLRGAMFKGPKV
jgi:hypothetical protein